MSLNCHQNNMLKNKLMHLFLTAAGVAEVSTFQFMELKSYL